MPVRGSGGELSAQIAPADFARLMRDVKAFDAALAKQTRARLRTAADDTVKGIRARILSGPAKRDVGLRKGLAAGAKVSIKTGIRTAGVSIVEGGSKLPASKQPMVRAYNKQSFRHRVFGGTDVWVTQAGRPNFGFTIDQHRHAMQAAMERALDDAAKTLDTGTVRV